MPSPPSHDSPASFVALDPAFVERLGEQLRRVPSHVVERGRTYSHQGRVRDVTVLSERAVTAIVEGGDRYFIEIAEQRGRATTECSCPAWSPETWCKHVVALVFVVRRGRRDAERAPSDVDVFVRSLHEMKLADFVDAIRRRGGEAELPQDHWRRLSDWWTSGAQRSEPHVRDLRATVTAWVPRFQAEVKELRKWQVPPLATGSSRVDAFYAATAKELERMRGSTRFGDRLPPPFDEGAAAFTFRYQRERSTLHVAERGVPSKSIVVDLPQRLSDRLRIDSPWPSLWDLAAMRALLLAMHQGTDAAVGTLLGDLARPRWEQILEHTRARPMPRKQEEVEIAFSVTASYVEDHIEVCPFERAVSGKKASGWKSVAFEKLLDGSVSATEPDRDVARIVLGFCERKKEATVPLDTALGHEVAKLLAAHPRVFASRPVRGSLTGERSRIVAGDAVLAIELEEGGELRPVFRVGDVVLDLSYRWDEAESYVASRENGTFVSARIPPALRPWLEAAMRYGDELVFPPEAASKLAAELEPLVATGQVALPPAVLGERRELELGGALRVQWLSEEPAVVELLVAVRPGAPLLVAADGPTLFPFEENGRRVYVERDFAAEKKLVHEIQEKMALPLEWIGTTGAALDLASAVALARFVEDNPLSLTIEVKVGRPPKVVAFADARARLDVASEIGWLSVRGKIELDGHDLSLGEVLEAARLARRFVRVGAGDTYVELTNEVQAALLPLATAAAIEAPKDDGTFVVNAAFAGAVAEGASIFHERAGVDPAKLVRSLERSRAKRVEPTLERGSLRPYQKEGAAWMLGLAAWAPGCVLADDMGLGKTVQTAAVLSARAKEGPALVVAPASVCSNWLVELERFAPSLTRQWFNEDRDVLDRAGPGTVTVVSYGLLQRDPARFAAKKWGTIVLDEAQYLKNSLARRTDAVKKIPRGFTIALTGTPLENHLGELWSIVDVVFPGLLGNAARFRDRFRRPIETERDERTLAALARLLEPFLLRRTRALVLEELPPREEIVEYVDLDPTESRRYAALRKACEAELTGKKNGTQAQLKIALLAALTRLRQLACDVSLVDPSFEGPSSKLARATEIVTQAVEEGQRVLVFSQFTSLLTNAEKKLVAAGLRVAYLAGDTPTLERRDLVDAFQAGAYDVFCISLKAGGTGLNLTRASHVVHLDPWWNPAVEEQATARAHRMGQTDPVTVYRLVSRGTIEEAILELHAKKRDLVDAVLEGKSTSRALAPSELLELLRFESHGAGRM